MSEDSSASPIDREQAALSLRSASTSLDLFPLESRLSMIVVSKEEIENLTRHIMNVIEDENGLPIVFTPTDDEEYDTIYEALDGVLVLENAVDDESPEPFLQFCKSKARIHDSVRYNGFDFRFAKARPDSPVYYESIKSRMTAKQRTAGQLRYYRSRLTLNNGAEQRN